MSVLFERSRLSRMLPSMLVLVPLTGVPPSTRAYVFDAVCCCVLPGRIKLPLPPPCTLALEVAGLALIFYVAAIEGGYRLFLINLPGSFFVAGYVVPTGSLPLFLVERAPMPLRLAE